MPLPEYPQREPSLFGEELEGLDEVVYVRPVDGASFSLNLTAASILDLCDGKHSRESIARLLHDSLPTDDTPDLATVRADVDAILGNFIEQGLILSTATND